MDSIGIQVVTAVAEKKGVDPTDLPLLNDSIDPDALDALFGTDGKHPPQGHCELRFTYAGLDVRVTNGDINVTRPAPVSESGLQSGRDAPRS